MPGYEITYHGDGFEVKITADTAVKLSVVRGAVSKALCGFKICGISDRERTVKISECTKVAEAAGKAGT